MDIPRPSQAKARLRRRLILGAVVVVVIGGITGFLARLEPAAPTVDQNLVWVDTVKRGPMVRQVHGLGTLVPENIRWIGARTSGRVEQILLRPGAAVQPDSVILVLSNPLLAQEVESAESQLHVAEADFASAKLKLQNDLASAEASVAGTKGDYEIAQYEAASRRRLFEMGVESELAMRRAQVAAENARRKYEIEQKRYAFTEDNIQLQLSTQEATVAERRSQARLRREEFEALQVRAGFAGILQSLGDPNPLQIGQQVSPGSNLARVADPTRLKAEIRIAETQAKDIQLGQAATVDTRNGVVPGRVVRIDPAVQNGSVLVDVELSGELPRGARPDLSVDGVIELDRLDDVVFVGRPAFGQEESTVGIYRLTPDGARADRVQVKLGRASVSTIEIVDGLQPGDRVILSDMSPWEEHDHVRLR